VHRLCSVPTNGDSISVRNTFRPRFQDSIFQICRDKLLSAGMLINSVKLLQDQYCRRDAMSHRQLTGVSQFCCLENVYCTDLSTIVTRLVAYAATRRTTTSPRTNSRRERRSLSRDSCQRCRFAAPISIGIDWIPVGHQVLIQGGQL
jgi:hypothetical protein